MKKRVKNTCLTFLVVLLAGYLFIDRNHWFGYTESATLYLAAVIGAGCCWLGSSHETK